MNLNLNLVIYTRDQITRHKDDRTYDHFLNRFGGILTVTLLWSLHEVIDNMMYNCWFLPIYVMEDVYNIIDNNV